MKKTSNILIVILIVSVFIAMIIKVNANEITKVDFNKTTFIQCKNEISDIIYDIASNNTADLTLRVSEFTSSCLNDVLKYASSNDINAVGISELIVDYTTPSNSSTGDTVIMSNIKVQYENQAYNKLYLLEFHVNKEGVIYGFNVWQY